RPQLLDNFAAGAFKTELKAAGAFMTVCEILCHDRNFLVAERLGGVVTQRVRALRCRAKSVQHPWIHRVAFQIDGGSRRRGDQRHLGVANIIVHRNGFICRQRTDRHRYLVTLHQFLQLGLGKGRVAAGILRDQFDLAAAYHAVALLEEQRGALFLLLAASGERPGENREETDLERLRGLRKDLRYGEHADRRARFEQRAAGHSGFAIWRGHYWSLPVCLTFPLWREIEWTIASCLAGLPINPTDPHSRNPDFQRILSHPSISATTPSSKNGMGPWQPYSMDLPLR